MKTFQTRKEKGITLVELILAILLMSTIVLAGYSLELMMRRMSVAPRVEAQLLDELIPIMELMKKSFEFESTGNFSSPSAQNFAGCSSAGEKGIQIRTGDIFSSFWRSYCWRGAGGSFTFEYDNGSGIIREIGYGITNFDFDLHPSENGTRLSVELSTRKDPLNAVVNPFTNPEVTLNSTFYSRTVPGA